MKASEPALDAVAALSGNPVSAASIVGCVLSRNPDGPGWITREMVHLRACELALAQGRFQGRVSRADYVQAKMELTGERDNDRQEAFLVEQVRRQVRDTGRPEYLQVTAFAGLA
jgi:hypothetical protein